MSQDLKSFLIGWFFLLISMGCFSQKPDSVSLEEVVAGKFSRYYGTLNVDSSISCLNFLDSVKSDRLAGLIEDELPYLTQHWIAYPWTTSDSVTVYIADNDIRRDHRQAAFIALKEMMAKGRPAIVKDITPVYYWVAAMQSENHPNLLRALTDDYLTHVLPAEKEYYQKAFRYGLLIQQIIARSTTSKDYSDSVLTVLSDRITEEYDRLSKEGHLDQECNVKRIWLKYLTAYCNYMRGERLMRKGEWKQAGPYFRRASYLSSNVYDQVEVNAFLIDRYLLFTNNTDRGAFRENYLAYLEKYDGNAVDIQGALFGMAFSDPHYKQPLKDYYKSNPANILSFDDFWNQATDSLAKPAPDFTLHLIDRRPFTLSQNRGKWILVDFWGTWCGPCRAEHPDLEKLYRDASVKDSSIFKIVTIARDDEPSVQRYMADNKYTFPVALYNDSLLNLYHVPSFPFKVLINPDGKYIVIPFGIDWVNFVKEYTGI